MHKVSNDHALLYIQIYVFQILNIFSNRHAVLVWVRPGLCLSDFLTFILNLNTFKTNINLMRLKIDYFVYHGTVSTTRNDPN